MYRREAPLTRKTDLTLTMIRHAEKDHSSSSDPGLSQRGELQAQKLGQYFREQPVLEKLPTIMSSPKRRCADTASRIAEVWSVPVTGSNAIDEQWSNESEREFSKRMDFVFRSVTHGQFGPFVIFISHADVLAELTNLLCQWVKLDVPTALSPGSLHLLRVSLTKSQFLKKNFRPG